ncbi:hypothetical protein J1605_000619 [Eschrichtius robustus]|uniref:Uncharacterized protein n=1 Tax=Eschrichtius robustus TaxID=9764 RepID=A0AB34GNU8_ESCRO|nr:hypothetical protein J1605_000619 [Eschrichtius robustus]
MRREGARTCAVPAQGRSLGCLAAARLRARLTCSVVAAVAAGRQEEKGGRGRGLNPEVGRRQSERARSGAQRLGANGEPWVPGNGRAGRPRGEPARGAGWRAAGAPSAARSPPGGA